MPFLSRRSPEPAPLPYAPDSPEGLAARWVQWVADASPLHNPVADETGEDAGVGQPEDVWFLAGSHGETVQRRVLLPAGRRVFVPAINIWYWPAEGLPEAMPDAYGSLTVDGVPVEPDEISTPVPFTVTGARLNGVTRTRKPTPTTVWGLWKLLPPLEPGEHVVRAVGGDGHGFVTDVRSTLVASEPQKPIWG